MSDRIASPGEAQAFFNQGLEQFEHLLKHESDAKMGMLVAMASGMNVVLVGDPGGGKTTLADSAYRLVDGISPDHVANIPAQADLQPQRVIGGEVVTTKSVETEDGSQTKETTTTLIDAFLNEKTKVIFANEINRINPTALNALLEVFESGIIDSTSGRAQLNALYSVATMNPAERAQSVFPMPVALASRYAIGAALGDGKKDVRTDIVKQTFMGWKPRPEAIQPVVTLEGLAAIRALVNSPDAVAQPLPLVERSTDIILKMQEVLRDQHRIVEADGRMGSQTGRLARTIAVLRGQRSLEEEDVQQAVRFICSARLGILATNSSGNKTVAETIDSTVKEVLDAA